MTENEQALFTLAEALGIEITIKGKLEESSTDFVKDAIEYLNKRTNSSYKHTTPGTIKLLRSLKSQGYTLKDIMAVIDSKSNEWEHDANMAKFLRPATLFNANKFEGYLQGATKVGRSKMLELFTKDGWDD